MQRTVRKHQSQISVAWSNRLSDLRCRDAWHEHDRPLTGGQELLVEPRNLGKLGCARESAHHHGKGLRLASLALAKALHDLGIVGTAGQMEAANPFDGYERPVPERTRCRLDDVPCTAEWHPMIRGVDEPCPRSTVMTRVRLRVEAAVRRVVILGATLRAHVEVRHGRERTIIRYAAHDRESRTAVRAIDERIAVAAIRRIEQLAEALVTGRTVGHDLRTHVRGALALHDGEGAG